MINGKDLAEAGYRHLGVPYSRMDCQAFAEQCLRDCGLEMNLAGSNAWFREVYHNGLILTPEDCVKRYGRVPAGAFLFILKTDGGEPGKYKPDGLGNASHIGIATGRGEGAVHSSASRGCVAESRFEGKTVRNGGWNRVGLWNRVDYGLSLQGEPAGDPPEQSGAADPAGLPAQARQAEPDFSRAVVVSGNGKPVNTRKGPGKRYPLSKAGKLPAGTEVAVLERKEGWDRIRCTDANGAVWICWMMDEFLRPVEPEEEEPDPGKARYTVSVPHLTQAQAEELVRQYPRAEMYEKKG